MDVDALAKTKGGKKGGKGKDKGGKSKKFEGNCFWCGAFGHMMEDCRKKAAGKPKAIQSPRGADPKLEGKGEGGEGKKGASSLEEWRDGQDDQPSGEIPNEEVVGLFIGAVSRHERYNRRDWLAWDRIRKQAQNQLKSYKSSNLCANTVDAELGGRIDLTIDSGCAACALPVGVASAIGMQGLSRTRQEYIAANTEKIWNLDSRFSHSNFRIGTCRF